jgi:hypothetical protein
VPNPRLRRERLILQGETPNAVVIPPGCRFHPRCPAAMDVCRVVVPPEVSLTDGVRVACHLYPPGGDALALPTPPVWVPASARAATPGEGGA